MLLHSHLRPPSYALILTNFSNSKSKKRPLSYDQLLRASFLIRWICCLGSAAAFGQCGTTWVGPTTGDWSTGSDWSHGEPTASTDACINNGKSAVTLDIGGAETHNLTISSGDSLNLNNAPVLLSTEAASVMAAALR